MCVCTVIVQQQTAAVSAATAAGRSHTNAWVRAPHCKSSESEGFASFRTIFVLLGCIISILFYLYPSLYSKKNQSHLNLPSRCACRAQWFALLATHSKNGVVFFYLLLLFNFFFFFFCLTLSILVHCTLYKAIFLKSKLLPRLQFGIVLMLSWVSTIRLQRMRLEIPLLGRYQNSLWRGYYTVP